MEIYVDEKTDSVTTGKLHQFDVSDRIAGTVTKLMTLEDTIRSNLRQPTTDGDECINLGFYTPSAHCSTVQVHDYRHA